MCIRDRIYRLRGCPGLPPRTGPAAAGLLLSPEVGRRPSRCQRSLGQAYSRGRPRRDLERNEPQRHKFCDERATSLCHESANALTLARYIRRLICPLSSTAYQVEPARGPRGRVSPLRAVTSTAIWQAGTTITTSTACKNPMSPHAHRARSRPICSSVRPRCPRASTTNRISSPRRTSARSSTSWSDCLSRSSSSTVFSESDVRSRMAGATISTALDCSRPKMCRVFSCRCANARPSLPGCAPTLCSMRC